MTTPRDSSAAADANDSASLPAPDSELRDGVRMNDEALLGLAIGYARKAFPDAEAAARRLLDRLTEAEKERREWEITAAWREDWKEARQRDFDRIATLRASLTAAGAERDALRKALEELKFEVDHGTNLYGHLYRYDCPAERVQTRCPIHDAFGLLSNERSSEAALGAQTGEGSK